MKYFTLALAGLALTACTTTTATVVTPMCDAAPYQSLVGQKTSALNGMPMPFTSRIIRPNQPVTMDYNENRINFETDRNDTITAVRCG
ncbi:I78 family peptidase inhibitor [Falsirhodobacter halotolerans]|uniref:I78 family peptidase inhibitor n=1 Tax=Falsirhodobacter halotolerans TaxID=1146892 RepID=UPI001FD18B74|nr:I78 family peptidase inhibitor [Falsirhodobacter halotolerans]MCJ8140707.1 I78 family peptidase inhibitor [Falsirhodobacter halotolerans]